MIKLERYFLNNQFGFTLLELMIVVLIASVLLTMGIPSFRTYRANQSIKAASFDLFSTLLFARSEAIKRGRGTSVSICKSSNGTSCGTDSVTWNDGWIVLDSSNAVIRVHGSVSSDFTITGPTTEITYFNNGRISSTGNITIQISSTISGTTTRCISIDISGQPNSSLGSC